MTDPRPGPGLGLLMGHASILALSSHANRTSPVDRGLWVMEILLGSEPPPPPPKRSHPGVHHGGGRLGTELHGAGAAGDAPGQPFVQLLPPVHRPAGAPAGELGSHRTVEDPGLPEAPWIPGANSGTASRWRPPRISGCGAEHGDCRWCGNFNRQHASLCPGGGRTQYYDAPAVRQIARQAAANDYRMSSFILGVVLSDPFRMQRGERMADAPEDQELRHQ